MADLCPGGPTKVIEKPNTEKGTLKIPTEKLNTGSSIRTSIVPKGPHPKLAITSGRKPAANAYAGCEESQIHRSAALTRAGGGA